MFIFLLASCGQVSTSNEPLSVTSSTQLLPLTESLARGFKNETNLSVVVKGTLGREAELLEKDLTDIIISSEELVGMSKNANLQKQAVAYDETLIVTYPQNKLQELTQDQLTEIFTGKIKNWKELGGENRKIQILARESGASIRRTFEKEFLNLQNANLGRLALTALVVNSNSEMKSAVSKVPGSIGYLSIGSLDGSVQSVKVLKNGTEVKSPRNLVFAVWRKDNTREELQSFLDYLLKSSEAKSICAEEGYVFAE
ncbi:MAG: substrate-binding domain-containing protein [Candidatus Caenarcaniphilales bacterium]|nr:substrate-binding domain-containing protein [Candidatus Caenarcaniphilales bacterium]